MSGSLKISEAASLALHTMVYLAGDPSAHYPAGRLAEALCVSEAHLAKVLQRLVKAGMLVSVRGPKGGFRLGAQDRRDHAAGGIRGDRRPVRAG